MTSSIIDHITTLVLMEHYAERQASDAVRYGKSPHQALRRAEAIRWAIDMLAELGDDMSALVDQGVQHALEIEERSGR